MTLQISKAYKENKGLNLNQQINLKGLREQTLYFLHNCKKRVCRSNKNFYQILSK